MATILVIDDDLIFYDWISRMLGENGHKVIQARTGFDGVQQADSNAVDLILLAISLPDMDGKVVATALRTRPRLRKIPIVAVTGLDDPLTRSLVQAFGCNDCIPKSIDAVALPQHVVTYLDKSAS